VTTLGSGFCGAIVGCGWVVVAQPASNHSAHRVELKVRAAAQKLNAGFGVDSWQRIARSSTGKQGSEYQLYAPSEQNYEW
jgi:hypothetical protein